MTSEVVNRRRETLLILTTGVFLAFFVSAAASVAVSAIWPVWPRATTAMALLGLATAVILLYLAVLSRKEQVVSNVKLVFCFDRASARFMDVPFSPASVNARATFDDLPRSRQIELAAFGVYDKFFGSEFGHLLHDLTQKVLLFSVFQDTFDPSAPGKRVLVDDLPESLKRNACVRAHGRKSPKHALRIPEWVVMETFGPFERFLRFASPVGKLELSWSVGYGLGAGATRLYWDAIGVDRIERNDFFIHVQILYEYRHLKMHTKRLAEFALWVSHAVNQLRGLDWTFTREHLPLVILSELGRKLSGGSQQEPPA